VRRNAAEALGRIGPEAKEAIPELARLVEKDPAESVRKVAREALEKIRK
jgi:HEAT repeat protein